MPSDADLTAYLNGQRVGVFSREGVTHRFVYDHDWLAGSGRQTFSVSLSKTSREQSGDHVLAFLKNLLPDNDGVLARWARRFQTTASPLNLLSHVGLDCAGAVQLAPSNDGTLSLEGGVDPVTDDEIAAHLEALHTDPSDWVLPAGHGGYFSLSGAQSKFALRRITSGWGVPWGTEPSTHILKPGVLGFSNQDLVEHLSLRMAAAVGLDAASTSIERFGDQTVIVVERYDRVVSNDLMVSRVHQEDFCQALGVEPESKYQSDGGPGIESSARMLRAALGPFSQTTQAVVDTFMDANAFNWLITGTDAHAKNYSLLHTARGSRLAPLYDLASALPYSRTEGMHERQVRLAMSIDKKFKVFDIERRHLERQSISIGVDPERTLDRARSMAEQLPDAASEAARTLTNVDVDHGFVAQFVDLIAARSERVLAVLAR